jgi:hypothetical protein
LWYISRTLTSSSAVFTLAIARLLSGDRYRVPYGHAAVVRSLILVVGRSSYSTSSTSPGARPAPPRAVSASSRFRPTKAPVGVDSEYESGKLSAGASVSSFLVQLYAEGPLTRLPCRLLAKALGRAGLAIVPRRHGRCPRSRCAVPRACPLALPRSDRFLANKNMAISDAPIMANPTTMQIFKLAPMIK